jgi:hypothetical protein
MAKHYTKYADIKQAYDSQTGIITHVRNFNSFEGKPRVSLRVDCGEKNYDIDYPSAVTFAFKEDFGVANLDGLVGREVRVLIQRNLAVGLVRAESDLARAAESK